MIAKKEDVQLSKEETKAPVRKTPKVRSSVASDVVVATTPKRSRKKIEEPVEGHVV